MKAQAMHTAFRAPLRRSKAPVWHRIPSLPKLLSIHGPGHVTMLHMHNVHSGSQAVVLEGRLETALTPTWNSVAPGGALLCDTCKTGPASTQSGTHKGPGSICPHAPAIPCVSTAVCEDPVYKEMFKKVARRVSMEWGIQLPQRLTLVRSIANWVACTLLTLFCERSIPPSLKVWL